MKKVLNSERFKTIFEKSGEFFKKEWKWQKWKKIQDIQGTSFANESNCPLETRDSWGGTSSWCEFFGSWRKKRELEMNGENKSERGEGLGYSIRVATIDPANCKLRLGKTVLHRLVSLRGAKREVDEEWIKRGWENWGWRTTVPGNG